MLARLLGQLRVPRLGRDVLAPDRTALRGGQGVLVRGDPRSPTQPRHHRGHPRTRRPDRPPPSPRIRWRTPRQLRPGCLQRPQRHRTRLQPAQAVARHRHPLRQARRHLPRSRRPRLHPHLAPPIGRHALAGDVAFSGKGKGQPCFLAHLSRINLDHHVNHQGETRQLSSRQLRSALRSLSPTVGQRRARRAASVRDRQGVLLRSAPERDAPRATDRVSPGSTGPGS